MEEKGNPKERIIRSAVELIYAFGFDAITINQIIQVSQTHKASFYRYFQNKEEVGKTYLQFQGHQFLENWKVLMSKSKSKEQFLMVWVYLIKRQIRKNTYHGCPIARFMASSDKNKSSVEIAKKILQEWINTLGDFFFSFEPHNLNEEIVSEKKVFWLGRAKQFMKIFQGNSELFIITYELSYIEEMEKEMLGLLNVD